MTAIASPKPAQPPRPNLQLAERLPLAERAILPALAYIECCDSKEEKYLLGIDLTLQYPLSCIDLRKSACFFQRI
jgi:hypothetical protein